MGRRIRLTRIVSMTNAIADQLQKLHFASPRMPAVAWHPAVNVYVYGDRLEVCVELAGVPKGEIEVQVEARRLLIRGERKAPERGGDRPPCGRLLVMEITDGAFERVLNLPVEVRVEDAEAAQENGLVWITLPRVAA
ncbi:MAG: Hsp20/alpha crystallin family protein [Verrucomicrobia bacterium]|nr:Hsp20/alpha crystallin family protein [Verrucomicrobiota bacterium]